MSAAQHTRAWAPLLEVLTSHIAATAPRQQLWAIAGAQGSGKSTLTRLLVGALNLRGITAVGCSLDDFYLTHAQRAVLAETVHPLLATRGVPGTHDVALCAATLAALHHAPTPVPQFDKGHDDRTARAAWPERGPAQVVVLEGWCVGAAPQPAAALAMPVNDLERHDDADGRWRGYVNAALAGAYATLFARVDALVYLQAPDLDSVRRWRAEQELQLPAARRMTPQQLTRFIDHYERITRWIFEDMPPRADVTAQLNRGHGIETVVTHFND